MLAGVVLFPTAEYVRHAASVVCAEQLKLPPGWVKRWIHGGNLANNLNRGIRENDAEWYWIMGDDHVYPPDIVNRLLSWRMSVVTPVCLMRRFPFCPVMSIAVEGVKAVRLSLGDLPPHGGLWEVERAGGAGMLIHREVIDAVGDPWFELGKIEPDGIGEDVWFSKKARDAGFKLYVDLDTWIGHQAAHTWVIPIRRPSGEWNVEVNVDNLRFYATTETLGYENAVSRMQVREVHPPAVYVGSTVL